MGPLSPRTEAIWWVQRICVRDLIHQLPSDVGSLLIVRISYDQKKQKGIGNSVFDLFLKERKSNRLVPHVINLSNIDTRLVQTRIVIITKTSGKRCPYNLPLFGE